MQTHESGAGGLTEMFACNLAGLNDTPGRVAFTIQISLLMKQRRGMRVANYQVYRRELLHLVNKVRLQVRSRV